MPLSHELPHTKATRKSVLGDGDPLTRRRALQCGNRSRFRSLFRSKGTDWSECLVCFLIGVPDDRLLQEETAPKGGDRNSDHRESLVCYSRNAHHLSPPWMFALHSCCQISERAPHPVHHHLRLKHGRWSQFGLTSSIQRGSPTGAAPADETI